MYARSLIVVALCTIFVVAFALVLSYDTAGVGRQGTAIATSQVTCSSSDVSCERLTINSASLRTVNYTDELGTVNYSNISLGFAPLGSFPLSSVNLFIGNQSAGQLQGPFIPGMNQVVNMTLPATIAVSHGKTYLLSVEGTYGSGLTVWAYTRITAD